MKEATKSGLNVFQWVEWLGATVIAAVSIGVTLVVFAFDRFETRDHAAEVKVEFKEDIKEMKEDVKLVKELLIKMSEKR